MYLDTVVVVIIDTACTQVITIPGLIVSTFFVSYLKIPQISTKIVYSVII